MSGEASREGKTNEEPKVLGRCPCGEGKSFQLIYIEHRLHRVCRTCGDSVDMEK
ncbi:hypothetical protein ACFFK0_04155 [Paenibacillus chartarius]|uniref:Uncharacterized protein n=1 Tax=Paenibacillus chartarius TaxID=747481 RepID=A0ABV6DGC6_9BACL